MSDEPVRRRFPWTLYGIALLVIVVVGGWALAIDFYLSVSDPEQYRAYGASLMVLGVYWLMSLAIAIPAFLVWLIALIVHRILWARRKEVSA